MAVASVGVQSQTAPPPPPPVPQLVHGYVYFDTGSAVPIRRYQTDTVGSEDSNYILSRRRALAVADLLVLEGVNPERITIMSCGERVLNRPTEDDTPEPLNRFALFDWSTQPLHASAQCPVEPYRR